MRLLDLRRLAIRKNLRIRFTLPNGMEVVLTADGLAKIPALKEVPSFNLEDTLPQVQSFRVEHAAGDQHQVVSLSQLEKMIAEMSPAVAAAADHDD